MWGYAGRKFEYRPVPKRNFIIEFVYFDLPSIAAEVVAYRLGERPGGRTCAMSIPGCDVDLNARLDLER